MGFLSVKVRGRVKGKIKLCEDHYWEIALTHASKLKCVKWVFNAKSPYQNYHYRGRNAENKCADIVHVIYIGYWIFQYFSLCSDNSGMEILR